MIKVIERIIKKLKNDKNYVFESDYSIREIVVIVGIRFSQIVRGYYKLFFNSFFSSGVVFCGKNVKIDHSYNLKAGKSLILEDYVYINALSHNGISLGNNVTIARSAIIVCTGVISNKGVGIKIGNNSAIGAQSFLGGQGGIEIGDDVIMGAQVKIFSENHNFEYSNILIRKQGESRKGIKINNNCWIGAGATILDGVNLGNGCIVAAGSVVTKSFPNNSVVAGVPAKIIKTRN